MPSTATTRTVTGLTNGTAVQFRVAAINGIGTGAFSAASAAVTPTAGDPLWSSVQLLLPGDTSTNDVSSYSRSVSALGGAAVSTAQKRWGAGSLYFGGSSDYLSFSDVGIGQLHQQPHQQLHQQLLLHQHQQLLLHQHQHQQHQ